MSNASILIAVAGVLGAAAYILSTRNADAEALGVNTNTGAVNSGRGFAINNPGNVRYIASDPYNGQVGNAGGYGIYNTLSNGVRAMGKVLTRLYDEGKVTPAAIISAYAPASENPTAAYIASVCGTVKGNPYALNVQPNATLVWPGDQLDLCMAMIYQENGYNTLSADDCQAYLNS